MQSELERKLARIEQTKPLDPRRVLIMVCPPISWWRVAAAALLPREILQNAGLDSDYIRQDLRDAPSASGGLAKYWNGVGRKANKVVNEIRKTRVCLAVHAGWKDLVRAVKGGYEVVILVAHHPDDGERVELADGIRPWSEVEALLSGLGQGRLLLNICSSKDWRDQIRLSYPDMASVGGGPHRMDFLEGLHMTALFANACDGERSFEEAWAVAETLYWQGRWQGGSRQ